MFSEFIAEKFHDPVIPGSLMDKPKRAATTDDNGGADSLVDVDLTLMQTQVPSKKSAESEVAETTACLPKPKILPSAGLQSSHLGLQSSHLEFALFCRRNDSK